tara:strand:- start:176 stop:574 length:399 start_codon:yes stop_codon:yes gene_type:complete
MKVIRLTESDIENLVKRIIKEDGEFDWTSSISANPSKQIVINSYEEMVNYANGAKWAPAHPKPETGKKYYDMYVNKQGKFTIFIGKGDERYACTKNNRDCYRSDDRQIPVSELTNLLGYKTLEEVPHLNYNQ